MPSYSLERKESVLAKLLNGDCTIAELARGEGISPQTLYAWRNQSINSGESMSDTSSSSRWDKRRKFAAVLETASLNAEELSAYCREKGLYPNQVEQWRDACMNGIESASLDPKQTRNQVRELKKDKQQLERELRRKEKALAESAALLVLAKKYRPLWEDEA